MAVGLDSSVVNVKSLDMDILLVIPPNAVAYVWHSKQRTTIVNKSVVEVESALCILGRVSSDDNFVPVERDC